MKKILFILLFIIPLCSIAQNKKIADGVFGVKLGSSPEAAVALLSAKGIKLDEDNSTHALYLFKGIEQGKRKNVALYLKIRSDKVYEVVLAYIYGMLPENVIQNYNELVKELNKDYGQGKSTRIFGKPFFDGDGHELEAIGSVNAKYSTLWTDENKNTLELMIFPTYTLLLTYHNSQL